MNRKLDVLIVAPSSARQLYQDLSEDFSAKEPNIWAGLLANAARAKGFGAAIYDMEIDPDIRRIAEYDASLILFAVTGQNPNASTAAMTGAVEAAERTRELLPETKIAFVGPHVNALPREVLERHPFIDIAFTNEGVYALLNLLSTDLSYGALKSICGIAYREGDDIKMNPPEMIVPQELLEQDLPGVAFDLMPSLDHYRTSSWHSNFIDEDRTPFASIYTSLGCIYKCEFCMINIINRTDNTYGVASDMSNKFRFWEPEFIISQFDQLAKLGVKNVKIADELFVLNPRHFMKVCELLIERDYGFNIWAYSRIDTCKPEYLETLKKAGVNWLGLGIENPNQTLRKEIHKDSFKDVKITDLFKMMRDEGLYVAANYIFGLPMDTHDSMKGTLEFALENKSEFVNMYTAMAYPGSPLYYQAKNKGWKLPEKYVGYSQHAYETLNLANENLAAAEILKFRDDAWMTYHTDEVYLKIIEDKFGKKARNNIVASTKIKLKRKLLVDADIEGQ